MFTSSHPRFRLSNPFSSVKRKKPNAVRIRVLRFMRRERDSNPRGGYPPTSLAGMRFQPLSHLSNISRSFELELSLLLSVAVDGFLVATSTSFRKKSKAVYFSSTQPSILE